MQQPNDPKQGYSQKNSPTLTSDTEIYKIVFTVNEEELQLWFEVSNPNMNLPLFEKVKNVAEHLLEPSAFQTSVLRDAVIDEFEKHGFKQHFPK